MAKDTKTVAVEVAVATPGLTKLVTTIKGIARDTLRGQHMVGAQTKLSNLEADAKLVQSNIDSLNKMIARYNFKLSKVDSEDPDADDLKKEFATAVEDITKDVTEETKTLEAANKAVTDQVAHIADIEAGKCKVDLESLNGLTKDMLTKRGMAAAVEA